MRIAIWIIAVVEIIRAIQNMVPVIMNFIERKDRIRMNNTFIESLKKENAEWCKDVLNDFLEKEGKSNDR